MTVRKTANAGARKRRRPCGENRELQRCEKIIAFPTQGFVENAAEHVVPGSSICFLMRDAGCNLPFRRIVFSPHDSKAQIHGASSRSSPSRLGKA